MRNIDALKRKRFSPFPTPRRCRIEFEWLEAGAHIVTVVPNLLEGITIHPYSKETVQMFLYDAKKAEAILGS